MYRRTHRSLRLARKAAGAALRAEEIVRGALRAEDEVRAESARLPVAVPSEAVAAWARWALQQADAIDPVGSLCFARVTLRRPIPRPVTGSLHRRAMLRRTPDEIGTRGVSARSSTGRFLARSGRCGTLIRPACENLM